MSQEKIHHNTGYYFLWLLFYSNKDSVWANFRRDGLIRLRVLRPITQTRAEWLFTDINTSWVHFYERHHKLSEFLQLVSSINGRPTWLHSMSWSESWKVLPFVSWPACFSRGRPVPSRPVPPLSLFPSYIWLYWRNSCYLSIAPPLFSAFCVCVFIVRLRDLAPYLLQRLLFPPTSDSFPSVSFSL